MSHSLWFASSSRLCVLLTMLTYAAVTAGCAPAEPVTDTPPAGDVDLDHADHDHAEHDHAGHDHSDEINVDGLMPIQSTEAPESLDAGIDQLVTLRDAIAKGFDNNDVDSIHDQLHSVGGLLEEIEKMIQASEMSDPVKQQATSAIESLFDAFGDVDAKLHGEDGKEYADVSEKINTAIETLSNLETPK